MKLYFRNSRAKFRPIANIDGRKPDKEIAKQIVAKINEFCSERNFKIYYTRIWHEECKHRCTRGTNKIKCKGKQMTKFDVGSHTEFFYFEKALPFAAFQGDK